jgi:predicted adenylyl cyclase CyaB
MTEIELKAHVVDPEATERTIRTFAKPIRETVKSDVYWKRESGYATEPSRTTSIAAFGALLSFLFALAAAVALIAGAPKEAAISICLCGLMIVTALSFFFGRIMPHTKKSGKSQSAGKIPEAKATRLRVRAEAGSTVVTYKRKEMQGDIEVNDEREFTIDDRSAFESLIQDLGFSPFIKKEKTTKSFSYRADDGTEAGIELSLIAGLGWFVEIEILADEPDEDETARAEAILRETLSKCGIKADAIESRYYTDMLACLTQERL